MIIRFFIFTIIAFHSQFALANTSQDDLNDQDIVFVGGHGGSGGIDFCNGVICTSLTEAGFRFPLVSEQVVDPNQIEGSHPSLYDIETLPQFDFNQYQSTSWEPQAAVIRTLRNIDRLLPAGSPQLTDWALNNFDYSIFKANRRVTPKLSAFTLHEYMVILHQDSQEDLSQTTTHLYQHELAELLAYLIVENQNEGTETFQVPQPFAERYLLNPDTAVFVSAISDHTQTFFFRHYFYLNARQKAFKIIHEAMVRSCGAQRTYYPTCFRKVLAFDGLLFDFVKGEELTEQQMREFQSILTEIKEAS